MSRKSRTALIERNTRRPQRSKHTFEDVEPTPMFATRQLLCGCWSSQPVHTCRLAPPPYCSCGATTGEGCACPSPIGRAS
jgi:hypothetical protein